MNIDDFKLLGELHLAVPFKSTRPLLPPVYDVYGCPDCSALVLFRDSHLDWHEREERRWDYHVEYHRSAEA